VPTPALEEPYDSSASALLGDVIGKERPPPMVWAGAASALLHLVLLLTLGLSGLRSATQGSTPELRLHVEPSYGYSSEGEATAASTPAPAQPITRPAAEALASPAGRRSVVQQRPAKLDASPRQPPASAGTDAAGSSSAATYETEAPAVAAAGDPAGEPVVTTVGTSEREQQTAGEANAPTSPGRALSGAQESMLARWILQAAQSLQHANLKQAQLLLHHDGRQYSAVLERRPAADAMDIDRVNVEISTEENGKRLRTLLRLKRLAFSHFTQLVDDWDARVQLHADQIVGRFHSNSEILVRYDQVAPRLLGKVTTAAVRVSIMNANANSVAREIFRGGLETRTPRIALPADFSSSVPPQWRGSAQVQPFGRGTRIVFYPDGSYGWRELDSPAPEQRHEVSTIHYIVASPGATICVRGTVRGKVVVYSPERIIVEGSLVYARDPRSSPDADDYLGLVSSKDIEIAPQSVTGPGDLEIHAAIYARRRFVVTDEDAPGTATLLIHGSLTAGSLSATEPRYATHYDYDRRFEGVRPPGFPVTDRFEVEDWDAQWREEASPPTPSPESSPNNTPTG
jgi:hypothetical protein